MNLLLHLTAFPSIFFLQTLHQTVLDTAPSRVATPRSPPSMSLPPPEHAQDSGSERFHPPRGPVFSLPACASKGDSGLGVGITGARFGGLMDRSIGPMAGFGMFGISGDHRTCEDPVAHCQLLSRAWEALVAPALLLHARATRDFPVPYLF